MNAPLRHERFVDFVQALVIRAAGGVSDERLIPSAIATGIGEGLGSAGGFMLPDALADQIWTRIYATGSIIERCSPQPVTRKAGILIPAIGETSRIDGSRFGGVRSFFLDEGQQITATKPKFDSIEMLLKKLLTLVYATDELVQDMPALAAFLERVMSLEMRFTIEDKIINGSGENAPLGVLNSSALITVAAEGAQPSSTVVYANLQKMVSRLWGPSHASALWLMSNEVFQQIQGIEATLGVSLFELGSDGHRYMMEIPVELTEYTPALGAGGDLLLADFSQYLLTDVESVMDQSIHVNFTTDETAFKLRYRVDGQPAWKTPVTPKNASVTQSPFITLAARP